MHAQQLPIYSQTEQRRTKRWPTISPECETYPSQLYPLYSTSFISSWSRASISLLSLVPLSMLAGLLIKEAQSNEVTAIA